MTSTIVTLADRPDLALTTGAWRWEMFFKDDGVSLADLIAQEKEASASGIFPTVLVLLEDEQPVGMVALCLDDLEDRPDLNPWLAGLYVEPRHRGQGHSLHLIKALETLAYSQGIERLSLYTASATELYARVGWATVETFEKDGKPFSIMQKSI